MKKTLACIATVALMLTFLCGCTAVGGVSSGGNSSGISLHMTISELSDDWEDYKFAHKPLACYRDYAVIKVGADYLFSVNYTAGSNICGWSASEVELIYDESVFDITSPYGDSEYTLVAKVPVNYAAIIVNAPDCSTQVFVITAE